MSAGTNGKVHHYGNFKLLDNVSAGSNQTSNALDINGFVLYAIQFSWSGFSGGATFYTEGSNDGTVWTMVDSFIPSGATGSRLLNVEKAAYAKVRVRYVRTTGAGTLLVTLNGKVT